MTPDALEAGKPYPGTLPDKDVAVFEFSKEGPELRLFFSGITEDSFPLHETRHARVVVLHQSPEFFPFRAIIDFFACFLLRCPRSVRIGM